MRIPHIEYTLAKVDTREKNSAQQQHPLANIHQLKHSWLILFHHIVHCTVNRFVLHRAAVSDETAGRNSSAEGVLGILL